MNTGTLAGISHVVYSLQVRHAVKEYVSLHHPAVGNGTKTW